MGQSARRRPKNYDGTGTTTHHVSDLLTSVLSRIGESYKDRPELIIAAWPEIIGQKLAPMTEAVSFQDGVLTVKVKNSTLHSLLTNYDKQRIINTLKRRFPKTAIKNVYFRIG